ncbi:hypothetical protein BGZ97_001749 [Linnemannia gamsii]|uniref:Enoyl reductase (ER) domain-containing protein n=1 Tax=Linnemannia gamsii TaxID=64522 RepID=A0A9P6UJ07_9FUNG|nr:hypothetical protein BGZ97_001749 [Linnemannia gamsii]
MTITQNIRTNTRVIRASYANKNRVTQAQFRIETEEIDLNSVKPGGIILRNLYLSLDPYVRLTLDSEGSEATAPMRILNVPFYGLGVAEVVASGTDKYPVGTLITANTGYEKYTVFEYADNPYNFIRVLPAHARDESTGVGLYNYVSALGMPGLTALAGLRVMGVEAGKTIFVGSAAGGVGQLVGQLAKAQGLHVIGSAGSEEKVNYVVTKLGFDSAFNYKTETTRTALARLAPKGIDYFYDTIGGETLETVVDLINEKGHILSIGMLSQENGKEGYPIRNLNLLAPKGATIHGFIYYHHLNYFGELDETVRPLLERGEIEYKQQVFDGIENAPEHFINMLDGKYAGKVAIKISDL